MVGIKSITEVQLGHYYMGGRTPINFPQTDLTGPGGKAFKTFAHRIIAQASSLIVTYAANLYAHLVYDSRARNRTLSEMCA